MSDRSERPQQHGGTSDPKPQPQVTGLSKYTLTNKDIQDTFEMLGLSEEANRAAFSNLRVLASGFHAEQLLWTSADSITRKEEHKES